MNADVFDVCIIGGGPAGLGFAQEWIKRFRDSRVILIDMGPRPGNRYCTVHQLKGCRKAVPCQVTSGIGGATGLAGGKLSEYPAGRGLSAFVGDSAAAELFRSLELLEPHLTLSPPPDNPDLLQATTEQYDSMNYELRHYNANKYAQDDLISAWQKIADQLEVAGVKFLTETSVVGVEQSELGVRVQAKGNQGLLAAIEARSVIVATGRTGSELTRAIGATGTRHPLDVGVRIEFPADAWPDLDAVHGDLKLLFGNARTFCTSKSGWITPYRYNDFMLLEGRTDSTKSSDLSNLAVSIRTKLPTAPIVSHIRSALLAQGPGSSIRQPLADYIANDESPQATRKPDASFSYWRWGNVNSLFPAGIASELRTAVTNFVTDVLPTEASKDAYVFGPELDYYWDTMPDKGVLTGVWSVGDITGEYRGTLQAYTAGRFLVSEVANFLSRTVKDG